MDAFDRRRIVKTRRKSVARKTRVGRNERRPRTSSRSVPLSRARSNDDDARPARRRADVDVDVDIPRASSVSTSSSRPSILRALDAADDDARRDDGRGRVDGRRRGRRRRRSRLETRGVERTARTVRGAVRGGDGTRRRRGGAHGISPAHDRGGVREMRGERCDVGRRRAVFLIAGKTLAGGYSRARGRGGGGAPGGEIFNIGAHRVTSAHVGGDRFARASLHGARVRGRAGVRRVRGIKVWM